MTLTDTRERGPTSVSVLVQLRFFDGITTSVTPRIRMKVSGWYWKILDSLDVLERNHVDYTD